METISPKYIIRENNCDLDWDYLVNNSTQGSIFSESYFLNCLSVNYKKYIIFKGDDMVAGFNIFLSSDELNTVAENLSVYNSIMFISKPDQKPVKKKLERFMLTELIIEFLTKKYKNINLSLSPYFFDLRPFLWYNYHNEFGNKKLNKFDLELRYTSILNIKSLHLVQDSLSSPIFESMVYVRKNHVKKAIKEGAKLSVEKCTDKLIYFYKELMLSQEINIDEQLLENMKSIMNKYCEMDRGKFFQVLNQNNDPLYIIFYAWDNKRAYYLYGAGNPNISMPWQGTFVHWKAIEYLAKQKIFFIDFEGVNSPKRGWFKIGFGGDLNPYYVVKRVLI